MLILTKSQQTTSNRMKNYTEGKELPVLCLILGLGNCEETVEPVSMETGMTPTTRRDCHYGTYIQSTWVKVNIIPEADVFLSTCYPRARVDF